MLQLFTAVVSTELIMDIFGIQKKSAGHVKSLGVTDFFRVPKYGVSSFFRNLSLGHPSLWRLKPKSYGLSENFPHENFANYEVFPMFYDVFPN